MSKSRAKAEERTNHNARSQALRALPFCLKLRQISFRWIISDGVVSGIANSRSQIALCASDYYSTSVAYENQRFGLAIMFKLGFTILILDEEEEFERQIDELKQSTAKKDAELAQLRTDLDKALQVKKCVL